MLAALPGPMGVELLWLVQPKNKKEYAAWLILIKSMSAPFSRVMVAGDRQLKLGFRQCLITQLSVVQRVLQGWPGPTVGPRSRCYTIDDAKAEDRKVER